MKEASKIVPMKLSHIDGCNKIVAASEPWKRLQESIDFQHYITLKQAHVCIVNSKVAGFVIFIPEPVFARGGYLRAIGVAASMHGLGIGKSLMAYAEKKTAARAQNLFLCVSSFNRAAQKFYLALGYKKAGALRGLIRPGMSEYIYWKRL